nr:helix-turn-helix domain-containing protein [Streptomonospora mangrovi]
MTGEDRATERRAGGELGAALRQWRDRVRPADVGLPADRPRRAAGLRREELARLAGISVDYVVRLEQGRASSPSVQVLAALARALRLTDEERRHLFLLAGRLEPARDRVAAHLTPGVLRLVDRWEGSAVAVFDAAWTLTAWNRLYAALAGDPSGETGRGRNLLWRHFTGMLSRVSHTPEQNERFERAAVADLRAATARYPGDTRLRRWPPTCGGTARASPNCGPPTPWARTSRTPRPCTTPRWACWSWTATCWPYPAATCTWSRTPPRPARCPPSGSAGSATSAPGTRPARCSAVSATGFAGTAPAG